MNGGRDLAQGEDVGGDPHGHFVFLCNIPYILESLLHPSVRALVYLFFAVVVTGAVLNPFEVRNRHTASIGKNVGYDDHPLFVQDLIRTVGSRAVGALYNQLCFDLSRVLNCDLVFECAGRQNVNGQFKQGGGGDLACSLETLQYAVVFCTMRSLSGCCHAYDWRIC